MKENTSELQNIDSNIANKNNSQDDQKQLQQQQSTNHILMVRPSKFYSNTQTLVDNLFQAELPLSAQKIAQNAYKEVTHAKATLQSHGIDVVMFQDQSIQTPDSVFPNNWFSTHSNGSLILYPMFAENRRLERKTQIIEFLRGLKPQSNKQLDLSHYQSENKFLEGTGSLIFDHMNQYLYVSRSQRTSDMLIEMVAKHLNIKKVIYFDSMDQKGNPIYHTNVMMSMGTHFVIVCLDAVKPSDRQKLLQVFSQTKKEVIEISLPQMNQFCGNALELQGTNEKVLVLSTTAYAALNAQQRLKISQHAYLQPIHVPTIESAGGSIRCMIAQLF